MMQETTSILLSYISQLDWTYIFTLIIIGYGLNNTTVANKFKKVFKFTLPKRFRILIIGFVYAIALYFVREYDISHVDGLFQSFVFAMVFHKLLVDTLVKFIHRKVSPVDEEV